MLTISVIILFLYITLPTTIILFKQFFNKKKSNPKIDNIIQTYMEDGKLKFRRKK